MESSLERLLAILHDGGFNQYTVADLGETVTAAVTVEAPTASEVDPLAAPPWASECERWYCVWSAASPATMSLWGLPSAAHYKEWRKGLKLVQHRACSSFEEARAGWYAEPGFDKGGIPELHRYE